jgi:hydroxyacylglutathione hydrolase
MWYDPPMPTWIPFAARATLALWQAAGLLATGRADERPDAAPVRITDDGPVYQSQSLRVYALRGVSNVYFIQTDAGISLVDAGLPTQLRTIRRRLDAIGHGQPLCQIVLTHAHIDHVGAAAALHAATGAPIVIHTADADALRAGRTHLGTIRGWQWTREPLLALEHRVTTAPVAATRVVTDGECLHDGGLDARFLHLPGHTAGSAALLVRDSATGQTLAFAGDLISTTGGAHIQSSYAEDWQQVAASLARLQAAAPDLLFPGHGAIALRANALAALRPIGPAAR